jgi:hypothetical protein
MGRESIKGKGKAVEVEIEAIWFDKRFASA